MSPTTSRQSQPSRLAGFPEYVSLSRTTTSSPAATRRFVKWEPMNPAPPVTSTRTRERVAAAYDRAFFGAAGVRAASSASARPLHGRRGAPPPPHKRELGLRGAQDAPSAAAELCKAGAEPLAPVGELGRTPFAAQD